MPSDFNITCHSVRSIAIVANGTRQAANASCTRQAVLENDESGLVLELHVHCRSLRSIFM